MASPIPLQSDDMDEADQLALAAAETEKLRYLKEGYWKSLSGPKKNDLYCASIDLKQFYPQLNMQTILTGLAKANSTGDERIQTILSNMLKFRVDPSGFPAKMNEIVEPRFLKRRVKGLPTGLFVSGFLANIAMQEVDILVDQELDNNNSIAHFRFVDDHTIIADDFNLLCDWIKWYEGLLTAHDVGPKINIDKFDPPSLSECVKVSPRKKTKKHNTKRKVAITDTRFDGRNPTKLMTKTLAQVSAIAVGDIHILDDENLQERLKMLEWLLLADIPEREIKSDTRAAFAAGQIAQLAPVLIQEADGLVSKARSLAGLRNNAPDPQSSTVADLKAYQASLDKLSSEVNELTQENSKAEKIFLKRCFQLLFGALQDHPGKSRLLFRVLQYCRVTGFSGLSYLSCWLQDLRNDRNYVWANYYAGLCLQILGQNAIASAKSLTRLGTLRSDQSAALSHLEDLRKQDLRAFLPDPKTEAWFHSVAKIEFGVSILVAAKTIERHDNLKDLAADLTAIAEECADISTESSHHDWISNTGKSPGVWAFQYESSFGANDKPSAAWEMFESKFLMSNRNDAVAVRWYPERMSEEAWNHFLEPRLSLPPSESGWIVEAINDRKPRLASAKSFDSEAFTLAVKSTIPIPDKITLGEWVKKLLDLSPFDPRTGEWTALEIMRQLIAPVTEIKWGESSLDRLHPHNIVLPTTWLNYSSDPGVGGPLNWFKWRSFLQSVDAGRVEFKKKPQSLIIDYRFAGKQKADMAINDWDRRVATVGFLLLGLFRKNFKTPRVWNIRGHEKVHKAPRTQWYQSLAISSPSLLLIESCISARSAETRTIRQAPSLFGYAEGMIANDIDFDPPDLEAAEDLLEAIENAQHILSENQLSVSLNQPRQLIPFRLRDFSTGTVQGGLDDDAKPIE